MPLLNVTKGVLEELEDLERDRKEKPISPEETAIPFMKIPNGCPADDESRIYLRDDNEPSSEELKEFFASDDARSRLVFCLSIRVDELDYLNIYGSEPGFFFLCGRLHTGAETLAEEYWLRGLTVTECPGITVPVIGHDDYFPRSKFIHQTIAESRTPRTYRFLISLLRIPLLEENATK